ncbi:hypothetical protein CSE16_05665 [Solibacillus sp. R5-41]|nr:hypothetical protein CSE16_05665 [Solibacillus sp. R5-41]
MLFLLTVFTSLTVAVQIGLLLAVVLFAKRMSEMLVVAKVLSDINSNKGKLQASIVSNTHDCPQISISNETTSKIKEVAEVIG